MRRRLVYGLLIGLLLTLLSLFYRTGTSTLEPMPYVNSGTQPYPPVINGLVVGPPETPTTPSLASRGLPLPIVSISPDEDKPSNYYKALILENLLIDYLLFTGVSYGFLSLSAMYKHPDSHHQNP